jgi:hypothetical protein
MYFVSYQLAQAIHLERIAEAQRLHRRYPSRRLVHSLREAALQLNRLAERLDPSPCT